jgi:RNA polymerase sigma-70 factor (ECF subfamily)
MEPSVQLAQLIAAARAAWPQLSAIGDAELAAHLTRHRATATGARSADLLLALGCASGLPAALTAFESSVLRSNPVSLVLRRIDASESFADEVLQQVRERLLIGKDGEPPRIAEYAGRGPLIGWTQVVALRVALVLRPAQGANHAVEDLAGGGRDPELQLMQEKYGKAFEEALESAFTALSDEQCNLLRLQIVDGLQTARIAALFHVDRSTIKRRLADCREALLAETRRILGERFQLSADTFDSLARLLQGQLNVSVARLLRARS